MEAINEIERVKDELLGKILPGLKVLRNRPEIARRCNMSLNTLNNSIQENKLSTVSRVNHLVKIGKVVADMLEEKKNKAKRGLQQVEEKLNSGS